MKKESFFLQKVISAEKKWNRFIGRAFPLCDPGFFVHYALKRELKKIGEEHGDIVVDIGCGEKLYASFFKCRHYVGIEHPEFILYHGKQHKADVLADAYKLPFSNESIDTLLSIEVLEHLENPQQLFFESHRVLKKNGRFVITVPFCFYIHGVPNDFYRFTKFGLELLGSNANFELRKITSLTRFAQTLINLFNNYIYYFVFHKTPARFAMGLALRPFLYSLILLLNLLGLLENVFKGSDELTMGYCAVFVKKQG